MNEALLELRKAQELDPLSAIIATDVAKQLYFLRRYDEAIVQLRKALELDPQFVQAHLLLQRSLMAKGMFAEAASELENTKSLCAPERYLAELSFLHGRDGHKEKASRELQELLTLSAQQSVDPVWAAMASSGLEDRDKAFQWLEKARLWGSPPATSIKVDMVWDSLRSDPRYQEFVKAMRLNSD